MKTRNIVLTALLSACALAFVPASADYFGGRCYGPSYGECPTCGSYLIEDAPYGGMRGDRPGPDGRFFDRRGGDLRDRPGQDGRFFDRRGDLDRQGGGPDGRFFDRRGGDMDRPGPDGRFFDRRGNDARPDARFLDRRGDMRGPDSRMMDRRGDQWGRGAEDLRDGSKSYLKYGYGDDGMTPPRNRY